MIATDVGTMKFLEKKSIDEYGIPSILLMENAAMGFVRALKAEYGKIFDKKICVVCGKGNNAGDGYAIARLLFFEGCNISILPVFDTEILSGDAKTNALAAKNMKIPFIKHLNDEYDIIIEAIFGTGFHGSADENIKKIIKKINSSSAYIASVDIPGGVSEDGSDCSVSCDLCVAFGYAKLHQLTGPAQNSFKKLIVAPISVSAPDKAYRLITKDTFSLLPKRASFSHKGTFGKVLAYVGSQGMAGAAVLSGSAVLKSGAGMLTLAVCDEIVPTIVNEFPSAMTLPLSQNPDILKKAEGMDSVLMGCGLGTKDSTKKTFFTLLGTDKPMVIDADGLNILKENINAVKNKSVVLTPHVAEFSRLCGVAVCDIQKNPVKHIKDFCRKYGVCVVLKDAVTVICDKDENLAVCHAPNSGMATAGSGDVLAGIIASMLAQGLSLFDGAVAGVYAHASAGAMAKDALSEAGMLSSDILSFVPKAYMSPYDIAPHIKEL